MIRDLKIFFMTVGEPVSREALEALKAKTPEPYDLTIWYDACGRGVDWDFYKTMTSYTDDVFLLTKNHAALRALGYAMLYLGGEHLMYVPADNVVEEGYLDRLEYGLRKFDRIGCIGSARVDDHPEYVPPWDFIVNDRYFMPDGVMLFPRLAIDDVGSIAPVFKGYGMDQREWQERAVARGWNMVSCKNVMREIGTMHDGRNMNPNLQNEIDESTRTYLKIRDSQYREFDWWTSRFGQKELMTA